jgi:hypothetical protein
MAAAHQCGHALVNASLEAWRRELHVFERRGLRDVGDAEGRA